MPRNSLRFCAGLATLSITLEQAELVLRNLSEGRVGGTDDTEHLGQGHMGNLRAAMGAGNADAAQAEAGEEFQFLPGQASFAVA